MLLSNEVVATNDIVNTDQPVGLEQSSGAVVKIEEQKKKKK